MYHESWWTVQFMNKIALAEGAGLHYHTALNARSIEF